MKNISVESLTAQVLELLREAGVPPKRLKDYKYCGFGEITKYFNTQGSTAYSAVCMDASMTHFRDLYEKEDISRWKWQQIRKAATWLEEFHASGTVTLMPLVQWEVQHNPLRREPTREELLDTENLFGLVYRTKQALMAFHLSEKSISNYTYDGFDSILRYCIRHGITKYSKDFLEDFTANVHSAYENHQLCRSVCQNIRKTVSFLEEYHDTGKLDWHYLPAWGTKTLTPLFSHAVDDYCEMNRRNQALADGTIATNKNAIRQFLFCVEEMGLYDFPEITHRVVNDCITILAPKYPHGMQSCIPAIRSFLTFVYDKGLIAEALQTAIPETSAPRRAIRHGFTPEELEQLLSAADRSAAIGKRDYAMMLLAIQTGLRVVDISGLTFQNIDWHGSEIHVVQHKTGRALSMPMEPAVGNAIADYILNGRPTAVRKLKEKGVEVFFEKENIYTMDSKGELLITIMSSLAQEESRSISENVAWGKRAKAAEGHVYLPYKQFLGYRKGEDGKPEIVEEEAQIVRRIYTMFLEGKTPYGIGKALQRGGILSPGGNQRWQHGTILSILTNEKYKGDAILQKTFCTDFLTKKMKRNEGELPQYYVEGSHPGIVPAEVYDEVQAELARRKESGYTARDHCFSGRILCADCGSPYIEKVWHSTSQYKRRIWQCARKYKNAERCTTPHLYEDEVKTAFLRIMNGMIADKDAVLADYGLMAKLLTDTRALDAESKAILDESEVVQGLIRQAIRENASTPLKQDEYTLRFNALYDRQTALHDRNAQIENERIQRKIKRERISAFIDRLRATDGLLTEFDEGLWNATVESVTVQPDGGLRFRFRDGREVDA